MLRPEDDVNVFITNTDGVIEPIMEMTLAEATDLLQAFQRYGEHSASSFSVWTSAYTGIDLSFIKRIQIGSK